MSDMWDQYYLEMQLDGAQQVLDSLLADVPAPRILEAGCGGASHYRFKPGATTVGIDISQAQLDRNKVLSSKILGDIQTYDLAGGDYDVVICHFVLEHLEKPEMALENFLRSLSGKGLIFVVAPNLYSIEGLVAKFTPLWFHVLVRRAIDVLRGGRKTEAIEEGVFPTRLRLAMTPSGIKSFAARRGLKIRYFRIYEGYEGWMLRKRSRGARLLFKAARTLGKALTLGRHDILLATYAIIMSRE